MGEVTEFAVEGHAAVITLNRPERLNALSAQLRDELTQALAEVRDNDDVRVAVLTGAGRGFCSGADLSGFDAAPLLRPPSARLEREPRTDRHTTRVVQREVEVGLGRRMRRELQVEPLILCLVQPAPGGTPVYKGRADAEPGEQVEVSGAC